MILKQHIGLEALDRITDADEIRAQIALLTAIYAKRTGKTDTKEACWAEAGQWLRRIHCSTGGKGISR